MPDNFNNKSEHEEQFESEEDIINSDSDIPGSNYLTNPLETDELKAQLEEQKDKFLRQAAEFDNFRRRTAKERIELIQTAGKDVIGSLLEVLDDCDRAESQMQSVTDTSVIREGTLLVFNKLRNTLQQKGLKAMDSIGEPFDVEQHEAISQMDAGPENSGRVIDEVQKGYFLGDKIIRFAKVIVGK